MPKVVKQSKLPKLSIDRSKQHSLSRQIQGEIAKIIISGRLTPGSRLPSSRQLGFELGVSRNTVIAAYEQLATEGYIQSAVGSGTRVLTGIRPGEGRLHNRPAVKTRTPLLSKRGSDLTRAALASDRIEARAPLIGSPALDLFPMGLWKRLFAQQVDQRSFRQLGYDKGGGYPPLRRAIADHLARSRGMCVSPEQVLVVAGAQQGLDIAGRVLLDPGDRVLFEDPGYLGARTALIGAGAILAPMDVDAAGMSLKSFRSAEGRARAAYVTPAHQFPLGVTMSLSRRLELLEWAETHNAWILEDDYDGDYRFEGNPLSSLASLDTRGRVLYIGTFSKVMFPALRIGFMVVPQALAGAIASARGYFDRHCPLFEQATLAAFMEQGHFLRHVNRMRAVYAERRDILIEALQRKGAGIVDVSIPQTGMQLMIRLKKGVDDRAVADRFKGSSLIAMPLSGYSLRRLGRGGLLLGFANASPGEVESGVSNLMNVIRDQSS